MPKLALSGKAKPKFGNVEGNGSKMKYISEYINFRDICKIKIKTNIFGIKLFAY
jgi:hypothetical protein